MNILKFEILDLKSGDRVVKVEGQAIHVSRSSGEYVIYTLKMDKDGGVIEFDVFAITQGSGSFELITDADLNDLAELWEE
ncbi:MULTISPECIES: hypothetical protein [Klebsiella pneumoniae complex]|uniref:Uncharacterized protein n=1 Tax=Klebsiella pneumoniae TaxID=573 RepID=A0A486TT54_KLEPN|nr:MULTISPECIES: hypothetical protein [Klebsiella]EKU3517806.1 hypothetical protein [Klebsiella quasipneumoniae]NKD42265.1 hypothetical protein [Escherichia coli]EKX7758247.1 hypothetical protein [Klebsiella quasipneumoniae]MCH6141774.1 hypothetical protein [Klebsiella variicola]MCH6176691.1 hypothetical protein [Klebsiella variicola]